MASLTFVDRKAENTADQVFEAIVTAPRRMVEERAANLQKTTFEIRDTLLRLASEPWVQKFKESIAHSSSPGRTYLITDPVILSDRMTLTGVGGSGSFFEQLALAVQMSASGLSIVFLSGTYCDRQPSIERSWQCCGQWNRPIKYVGNMTNRQLWKLAEGGVTAANIDAGMARALNEYSICCGIK